MAVLTALPSQGSVKFTHNGEVTEDWDGKKLPGTESRWGYNTDHSQLIVAGGSELSIDTYLSGIRGSFDIEVREGGSLTFPSSASMVRFGNSYGDFDLPNDPSHPWKEGLVKLKIDGGTVDIGEGAALGCISGSEIQHLGESASVKMEVDIARGTLFMNGGGLGYVQPVGFSSSGCENLSETISIRNGGSLQASGDGFIGGWVRSLDIHLYAGSTMDYGGYIGYFDGFLGTVVPSVPEEPESLVPEQKITVDKDSTLVLTNAAFSYWGWKTSGWTGKATLSVNGGTVIIGSETTELNHSNYFSFGRNGQGACNLTINLVLNSGTIDVYAKDFGIGGTDKSTSFADPSTKTEITINGGEFTIHEQQESSGKEHITGSKLVININGGVTQFHRGEISACKGTQGNVESLSSVLNLNGGELTIDSKARFTGNINVTGGSLTFGEGCYLGGLSAEGNGKADPDMKTVTIDIASTWNEAVTLNGLDAKYIISNEETGLKINGAGATLQGLAGGTLTIGGTKNEITLGNASISCGENAATQAVIGFAEGTEGTVELGEGSRITLHFSGNSLELLKDESSQVNFKVWLTNGELTPSGEETYFVLGNGWGLSASSVVGQEGWLLITGNTSGVWFSSKKADDGSGHHAQADASGLESYEKVYIDEDTDLTVEGDSTIKELETRDGRNLVLSGKGEGGEITLHNETTLANPGGTLFNGDITAKNGVDLKKDGNANLTVEGSLKAGGNVSVEEGALVLGKNSDSSIGGTLSLGDKENDKSGELQVDGKLTLSGGVSEDSQGSITGSGTVVLDGDFTVGGVELGKDLTFQMGKAKNADFGNHAVTLQDLEGDKEVTAGGGVTLKGEGTFSGAITGDTTMQGEYALNGANIDGTLDSSGKESIMILSDASEEPLRVQKDLVLRKDATTRIFMDLSNGDLWQDSASDTMVNVNRNIIIEDGTIFEIHNLKDIIASNEDLKNVVIMRGAHVYAVHETYTDGTPLKDTDGSIGEQQKDEKVKVNLTGTLNWRYKEAYVSFMNSEAAAAKAAEEKVIALFRQATPAAETETLGSTVSLTLIDQDVNPVVAFAGTSNEKAGAALVSGHVLRSSINGVDPDVERMAEGIAGAMESNPSAAHRALAAVAGSTLTSLSAAQSAALRNQMSRVRDHALQAARLRCAGNADEATAQQRPCKNSHVWVEGTGFFSEQHSVDDESGYRLNSWGGALGIDAQVDAHWSVGVSLSASYGDLEARAADYAKGDLDTYTVSFWSQAKNGRWGNTLLFTLGTNEADLKRTVNYGAGSYTATSNTSGSSLGAMWELTYDFHPVKDNKSNILQPLFNVALMRTSMDGFSEKNAGNVGLTTEKQTRDTVTLGLGLRWLAAINSAKAVNRTVSTEVHANVAQDLGDRRSVANVALLADPSYTQNVYGSKAGSTAFQFGAGVNVPMTPNSQIYVNAGGELREHANAWNAAMGIRMGF